MDEPPATLTLTKHQALGNDFLVTFDALDDPAELARRLCDRRLGVGADGLLVASPEAGAWRMVLHNADGSRAEMSGNGIRCFAHAVVRRVAGGPASDRTTVTVLTDAGERVVEVVPTADPSVVLATVDMGDVADSAAPARWAELGCDPGRPVAHLSLGNPHSVVLCEDVDDVDLAALGGIVPDVNLEIVEPGRDRGHLRMRVHERGAGLTAACGTGATATAFAARRWGLVGDQVEVEMPGGSVTVRLAGRRATLVGPAAYVATVVVDRPPRPAPPSGGLR